MTGIKCYADFVGALLEAGFAMGGKNSEGVFSLTPFYEASAIKWHTENPETDPWEWRMRVLNERNDISYGKIFFKKSGYLTRAWAPYFIAARRGNAELAEDYENGIISNAARRIYNVVLENETLPLHAIKQLAGFSREDKSRFDRALVELQMKMYLSMCGSQQKTSSQGEEYGWSSTVFCTTEHFWGEEVFEKAKALNKNEAFNALTKQIMLLNPAADSKNISRFILG